MKEQMGWDSFGSCIAVDFVVAVVVGFEAAAVVERVACWVEPDRLVGETERWRLTSCRVSGPYVVVAVAC